MTSNCKSCGKTCIVNGPTDEGFLCCQCSQLTEKPNDPVNHPTHYNSHPSGIECIEVVRHFSFNLGNAIKYMWRSGLKDEKKEVEDLEKAIFYIKDEIERIKNEQKNR